jgi:hypothetical protein
LLYRLVSAFGCCNNPAPERLLIGRKGTLNVNGRIHVFLISHLSHNDSVPINLDDAVRRQELRLRRTKIQNRGRFPLTVMRNQPLANQTDFLCAQIDVPVWHE